MDAITRCKRISNSYYNRGLQLASERNLTGAADNLKRSLQFNKNNTHARNLLGLIYYEIGEVADALVQWVLSLNLQPRDNDADRYLNEIQRQSGFMESRAQMIAKFNQCLTLAQSSSDDLAILQLQKICEHGKNYVRAHQLLGLLYMTNQEYAKAYRVFQRVLRIDRGNRLSLQCIDYLKAQRPQEPSKKSIKDVFVSEKKKEKGEEYIVPEPYRENTGLGTAANIGVGLLIGALAVIFIYLPSYKMTIADDFNKQVISVSNRLNNANSEITDLEEQIKEMEKEYQKLDRQKSNIDNRYAGRLSAFQKITGAMSALKDDDLYTAGSLYASINPRDITDVQDGSNISMKAYYEDLKTFFDGDGYIRVMGMGDNAYEARDYDAALDYYELSVAIHADNPACIYKQGLCYAGKGDRENAARLFTEVIKKYPNTEIAAMAKSDRGY